MNIRTENNNDELTMFIEGRLDTTTAPSLEAEISQNIEGIKTLILDFESLEYISSAGLRVLLSAQKKMNKQGKLLIRNVNEDVRSVLDMTGFTSILTIE